MGVVEEDLIKIFPLDNYEQKVESWINPENENYDGNLMEDATQNAHFQNFLEHYCGSCSPWNKEYINHLLTLTPPNDLKTTENEIIEAYSNKGKADNKIGYGENFRPHSEDWINNIKSNVNLDQFDDIKYDPKNCGIVTSNVYARAIPTDDVHFHSYKIAGEGYPFDNLQISSLLVGTSVYILAETLDKAWFLVLTPDYTGWVHSSGISRVNEDFINLWVAASKDYLAAITQTSTSISDDENGKFLLLANVGAVFPAKEEPTGGIRLMVPVPGQDSLAIIKYSTISSDKAIRIPIKLSPHNLSNIITTLQSRPYGWGNEYFYNDCSAELKNLFTPFGIYLPRHSSDQVKAGAMVDVSSYTPENRLQYLFKNGKPFVTIIYIGGHVVLYIGAYPNPKAEGEEEKMAMTYQNVWGLRPPSNNSRSVIGQSLFFPMLLQYPEDPDLVSLADKSYFQVAYLDEMKVPYLTKNKTSNLKSLRGDSFMSIKQNL